MSENWHNCHSVELPKECCKNCKKKLSDKACPDLEKCHQVRYDHECYPIEERYLMFKG